MTYLSRMFLAPRKAEAGTPPVNPWYDPNGEGLCVWEAWQAKGAASYAASLLGLANGRNLTEGNGAVPWAAATGWVFAAASLQWLATGFIPDNDQSQSVFVQYANNGTNNRIMFGMTSGANRQLALSAAFGGGVVYSNGAAAIVAPNLNTGNIAVVGSQGYRNAVVDGGALGVWAGASADDAYIGARNNTGAADSFCTDEIRAVVIYDCVLTAPQVLAIVLAMTAL